MGQAVAKGESVKSIVLFGFLFSLLWIGVYNQVAGTPRESAQAVTVSGEKFPARFSEYLSLHQTRYENIPSNAIAGAKACPE